MVDASVDWQAIRSRKRLASFEAHMDLNPLPRPGKHHHLQSGGRLPVMVVTPAAGNRLRLFSLDGDAGF